MAHRKVEAVALGGLGDPLGGFFVRPHQQRPPARCGNQVCEQGCATEHPRVLYRRSLLQGGHAVKVRVNRDQAIKQLGQKAAHDALADGFTGVKGEVLPHVCKVRRDQRELARPECSGGARHQQQGEQFFIRLVQRAQHGHPRRQALGQAQLELAIGKTVAFNAGQRHAGGGCNPVGVVGFVFEMQQQFRGFSCFRGGRDH